MHFNVNVNPNEKFFVKMSTVLSGNGSDPFTVYHG